MTHVRRSCRSRWSSRTMRPETDLRRGNSVLVRCRQSHWGNKCSRTGDLKDGISCFFFFFTMLLAIKTLFFFISQENPQLVWYAADSGVILEYHWNFCNPLQPYFLDWCHLHWVANQISVEKILSMFVGLSFSIRERMNRTDDTGYP